MVHAMVWQSVRVGAGLVDIVAINCDGIGLKAGHVI